MLMSYTHPLYLSGVHLQSVRGRHQLAEALELVIGVAVAQQIGHALAHLCALLQILQPLLGLRGGACAGACNPLAGALNPLAGAFNQCAVAFHTWSP